MAHKGKGSYRKTGRPSKKSKKAAIKQHRKNR